MTDSVALDSPVRVLSRPDVAGVICVGVAGADVLAGPLLPRGGDAGPMTYVVWVVALVAALVAFAWAMRAVRRHVTDATMVASFHSRISQLNADVARGAQRLGECQVMIGARDEQLTRLTLDIAHREQRLADQAEVLSRLARQVEITGHALGFIMREGLPAVVAGEPVRAWPTGIPAGPDMMSFYDSIVARVAEQSATLRQVHEALRASECQAATWLEGVQFFLERQLPALAAGQAIPTSPIGVVDDAVAGALQRLSSTVRELLEHAVARSSDREEAMRVATIGLARNVQALAHRVQEAATAMVLAHPSQPDVLDSGYRIDHVAAQQARHAQNLAVLCGESPGQQWQEPVAVADIVSAARSRIVAYDRVRAIGDPDIAVVARVAEPVISVIAELLANAAQSSPPTTEVEVRIRSVQRGVVFQIEDCGVGMEGFRLQQARDIASGHQPIQVVDLGQIPHTGLAVVGEYVRRHQLRVDLDDGAYGGVRAVVFVPGELTQVLDPATRGIGGRDTAADPGRPEFQEANRRALAVHPAAPGVGPAAADLAEGADFPALPQRRSRRHARVDDDPFAIPRSTLPGEPAWPLPPSPDEAATFLSAVLTSASDSATRGALTDTSSTAATTDDHSTSHESPPLATALTPHEDTL